MESELFATTWRVHWSDVRKAALELATKERFSSMKLGTSNSNSNRQLLRVLQERI